MPTRAVDADSNLRRKGAVGDLAIERGAGKASAGEHGLDTDNLFKVGHWTFFHSLTVVGTPLEEQLANKMSVASAFFRPSGPSVHKDTATKRRREKVAEA